MARDAGHCGDVRAAALNGAISLIACYGTGMATGWTQRELDELLNVLDQNAPAVPNKSDKKTYVTALRVGITDKGVVIILETRDGEVEIFWLNCWAAKELAGAISYPSEEHGWARKGFKAEASDHVKEPTPADLHSAVAVHSLSSQGDLNGIMVRFAVGYPVKHRTLYFSRELALEVMLCIGDGGTRAEWWDQEFNLIPSRESQN